MTRAEIYQRYRERNLEKVREAHRKDSARRRAENPERDRERCKEYYQNNRDKHLQRMKERRQRPDYQEKRRQYVRENAERDYRQTIARKYGLKDFDGLLASQGGVCAVCQGPPSGKRFVVDHCHITGVVRGLLCGHCNSALGMLRDNAETARRAAAYLERTREKP